MPGPPSPNSSSTHLGLPSFSPAGHWGLWLCTSLGCSGRSPWELLLARHVSHRCRGTTSLAWWLCRLLLLPHAYLMSAIILISTHKRSAGEPVLPADLLGARSNAAAGEVRGRSPAAPRGKQGPWVQEALPASAL